MKNPILTLGIAVLFTFGSATFIGCGNEAQQQNDNQLEHVEGEEHTHDDISKITYHCPMKCEDEKTYDKKGTCPICEMDLVETE